MEVEHKGREEDQQRNETGAVQALNEGSEELMEEELDDSQEFLREVGPEEMEGIEDEGEHGDMINDEAIEEVQREAGAEEELQNEEELENDEIRENVPEGELLNDNENDEVLNENRRRDNTLFLGFGELEGMRAPLRNNPDIRAIDLLLMVLAEAVRFHESYVQLEHKLQWLKQLYINIKIPTTKRALWKVIGKDDTNLIYTLYCEECLTCISNGKKVTNDCTCGLCGLGKKTTYVATFVQIRIAPQLKGLLKCPKVFRALQYKHTRVKMFPDAIEDIYDGTSYKALSEPGGFLFNKNNFSLTLWIDGASLAESPKASMWPILLQVNELPPHARKKHMILSGMWVARKKPCMVTIMNPIVHELIEVYINGIEWITAEGEEVTSKFITVIFTADSVARPAVLRMKQYNGEFGCTFCTARGKDVQNRRIFSAEPATMRTNESIRSDALHYRLTNTIRNGVLGWSPLASSPEFDLVDNVAVDQVHAVFLGAVKKHLDLIFTNAETDWYIESPANITIIDTRMPSIRTPSRLARQTRSITTYNMWKASELRNWLLYYAIPCLHDILPQPYFDNLALLTEAIYICNSSSISDEELTLAIKLIAKFVSSFEELYGEINMVYNIHLLTHLPISVRHWGPAWVYSTFTYESMNKKFVDSVSSPVCRAEQIVTRFFMEKFVRYAVEEYDIVPVTRTKIQEMLEMTPRNIHPGMPEGHYFLGKGKATLELVQQDDIALLHDAQFEVEENTEVHLYKSAIIHGVNYEVENDKDVKTCDYIAYCRNGTFIKIEKILSYSVEGLVAGFIGKKFKDEGQAFNTIYMKYVSPTIERTFVSYKDILAPGIITPNTETKHIAMSLCNIWETD